MLGFTYHKYFILANSSPQLGLQRVFLLSFLRFLFLQTHATSYSFFQRVTVLPYTVKDIGGKIDRKSHPLPFGSGKPCRNSKELSRLCPETSKKWYIHEFDFCTCWSISSSSLLLRWATIPEPMASPRTLMAVLNLNNEKKFKITDQ
jgi:hypothetical protein